MYLSYNHMSARILASPSKISIKVAEKCIRRVLNYPEARIHLDSLFLSYWFAADIACNKRKCVNHLSISFYTLLHPVFAVF